MTAAAHQQQAADILNNPYASVILGTRPLDKRKPIPGWRKALFALSPIVINPLKYGALALASPVVIGMVAGLVYPGATVGEGTTLGIVAGATLVGPAMGISNIITLLRTPSRLKKAEKVLRERDFKLSEKRALREEKKNARQPTIQPSVSSGPRLS